MCCKHLVVVVKAKGRREKLRTLFFFLPFVAANNQNSNVNKKNKSSPQLAFLQSFPLDNDIPYLLLQLIRHALELLVNK